MAQYWLDDETLRGLFKARTPQGRFPGIGRIPRNFFRQQLWIQLSMWYLFTRQIKNSLKIRVHSIPAFQSFPVSQISNGEKSIKLSNVYEGWHSCDWYLIICHEMVVVDYYRPTIVLRSSTHDDFLVPFSYPLQYSVVHFLWLVRRHETSYLRWCATRITLRLLSSRRA